MTQQSQELVLREGDSGPIPARTDRIFEMNSYYYYSTREGIDIGPFDTWASAQRGVEDFIDFMLCGPQSAETLLQYSTRVA